MLPLVSIATTTARPSCSDSASSSAMSGAERPLWSTWSRSLPMSVIGKPLLSTAVK
jgi:hypothetical protein